MVRHRYFLLLIVLAAPARAADCSGPAAVCPRAVSGGFALISNGAAAPVWVDGKLDRGVTRAICGFRDDLGRVAASAGPLPDGAPPGRSSVIVGTLGRSPLIDGLVRDKRLNVSGVARPRRSLCPASR